MKTDQAGIPGDFGITIDKKIRGKIANSQTWFSSNDDLFNSNFSTVSRNTTLVCLEAVGTRATATSWGRCEK